MAAAWSRVRPALAAVTLAAGALAALTTALGLRADLVALWRPHLDMRMLRDMAEPLHAPVAARRLFEQAPPARGTAADFLRTQAAGWAESMKEETAVPAGPGWQVRKAQVARDAVPMAEAALLLEQAEAQRPPWRAASLTLEPVGTAGVVRVELGLERIERVAP